MRLHKFWLIGFLWVFVLAQSATLWHTEVHPFHEHTEACQAFHLVQHQSGGLIDLPTMVISDQGIAESITSTFSVVSTRSIRAFFGRAPPTFS